MALTPKQRKFVAEYRIDFNARQAAIRAGYTLKSATQTGRELLALPHIQQALTSAMTVLDDAAVSWEDVAAQKSRESFDELCACAFSDMREVAEWTKDGVLLIDSRLLTDKAAKAIQEVRSNTKTRTTYTGDGEPIVTTEVQTSIKLYNKLQALEELARRCGVFDAEKVESEQFFVGFVDVVKQHAGSGEARQAIIAYLRRYLGSAKAA